MQCKLRTGSLDGFGNSQNPGINAEAGAKHTARFGHVHRAWRFYVSNDIAWRLQTLRRRKPHFGGKNKTGATVSFYDFRPKPPGVGVVRIMASPDVTSV